MSSSRLKMSTTAISVDSVIASKEETRDTSNDIIINAENIKFCPGPCNDYSEECPPETRGNEKRYFFKPYSGGRYNQLSYPMQNGGEIFLKNVRMCSYCCKRLIEFDEEGCIEYLQNDSKNIIKKLQKMKVLA